MAFEFKLPDIGEGVVEGEIVHWLIKAGDSVSEDQPMVEIMTDKATVEIPSPRRGKVISTLGNAGDIVKVGATLVVIEEEGAATAPQQQAVAEPKPASATAALPPPAVPSPVPPVVAPVPLKAPVAPPSRPAGEGKPGERALASPATRKLARELGVDIETVPGTGSHGRITSDDVRQAAAAAPPVAALSAAAAGGEERIPLRGMRKRIAERMAKSKFTAPHFTYVDEVDVTELVKLRAAAEPQATDRGLKLSYLPFIVKASVYGLKKFPIMNASLDDAREEVVLKKYYNIGIAVATDTGLIVPVVKDADRKSIFDLAAEIQHLSTAAREGKVKLEELQGGTFTITSLGAIGGLLATPIINYPEVAILGIHKIEPRPVVRDGNIVVRQMMNVSVSLDHRIVDGVVAAQFTQELFRYLEQPSLLFLDRL